MGAPDIAISDAVLRPNESLISNGNNFLRNSYGDTGEYVLHVQDDGNMVIYEDPEKNFVWATNTGGKGVGPYSLINQDDGNIVLFDSNNAVIWATNTQSTDTVRRYLVLQSDRNLCVYDAVTGNGLWVSGTENPPALESIASPEEELQLSPCALAVTGLFFSAFFFILTFLGVRAAVARKAANKLAEAAVTDLVIEQLARNLANAPEGTERAKALFALLSGIFKITGLMKISKALYQSMSWLDFALMGVVIVAQIIALFATDGAAVIAEFVLLASSTVDVIQAAVNVGQKCG